jgi:predicted phosphodiesterase
VKTKKSKYKYPVQLSLFVFLILIFNCSGLKISSNSAQEFSFFITADMRQYAGPEFQSSKYFLGVCEAIKMEGKGAFMVSTGDIDPPWFVRQTITSVLGENYIWYPVLGNHETETSEDMAYLREYNRDGNTLPYIVNKGPAGAVETMYSFDYGDAHFVVVNQYYNGVADMVLDGDTSPATYEWLAADLKASDKKYKFVFGHEPAYVLPDMKTGRLRHENNSLNKYPENRDRFWNLLKENRVVAYVCGHTHNTSIYKFEGVYQIDAGHSRGIGDQAVPSTFVKITVGKEECIYRFFRDDTKGGAYSIVLSGKFE